MYWCVAIIARRARPSCAWWYRWACTPSMLVWLLMPVRSRVSQPYSLASTFATRSRAAAYASLAYRNNVGAIVREEQYALVEALLHATVTPGQRYSPVD